MHAWSERLTRHWYVTAYSCTVAVSHVDLLWLQPAFEVGGRPVDVSLALSKEKVRRSQRACHPLS